VPRFSLATVYEPPPHGIGRDRLAVAEEDDAQQDQDHRDDGNEMGDAGDPERDQQGQRRLRPVRGGGQGIEAENGIPAATPTCSARSSLVARGLPNKESVNDIEI
jgi:hypothetical protein